MARLNNRGARRGLNSHKVAREMHAIELRPCGHEVSRDHGRVVYSFELWRVKQNADGEARPAELVRRFGARFSALKTVHQVLSAGRPAQPPNTPT